MNHYKLLSQIKFLQREFGQTASTDYQELNEEQDMLSFDYGLPAAIVVALIVFAWFSFFSVVFSG